MELASLKEQIGSFNDEVEFEETDFVKLSGLKFDNGDCINSWTKRNKTPIVMNYLKSMGILKMLVNLK